MKVLVIDDDQRIRDALEIGLQLQWQDAKVLTAADGEAGLDVFINEEPVIVLLDVARRSGSPAIFATNYLITRFETLIPKRFRSGYGQLRTTYYGCPNNAFPWAVAPTLAQEQGGSSMRLTLSDSQIERTATSQLTPPPDVVVRLSVLSPVWGIAQEGIDVLVIVNALHATRGVLSWS